jgi:plastocyanin
MSRKLLVLLAVVLAFGLAACGGGDDDEDETTAETTTEETTAGGGGGTGGGGGGGETIAISETEFSIDPADPSAPAGEVTFEITNDGSIAHNLEVEGDGVEEVSDTIDGGESTSLTVDLDPGEYEIYCNIGNHAEQGMEGTLTVE